MNLKMNLSVLLNPELNKINYYRTNSTDKLTIPLCNNVFSDDNHIEFCNEIKRIINLDNDSFVEKFEKFFHIWYLIYEEFEMNNGDVWCDMDYYEGHYLTTDFEKLMFKKIFESDDYAIRK